MKKNVTYMMTSGLLAAVLLAGCSSNTDTAASSTGNNQAAQTQSDGTAAQPAASPGADGQGMNGMDRANMNIGKIKSISGSTITLYTAEMPEGMPQGGGNGGGTGTDGQGTPPEGGEGGQSTEGQQGTAPEGGTTGDQASGQNGQQGGMGGGMMQNFSEETTDITVSSDTTYVSVTFENNERKETTVSLADLKADDVIQYTLKTDTTEAESITLGTGGFGGGGGGRGGAPGADGGQAGTDGSTDSSATTDSSSK